MKCLNCQKQIKTPGVPYCSKECWKKHGLGENK